jgi:hypothetical protein
MPLRVVLQMGQDGVALLWSTVLQSSISQQVWNCSFTKANSTVCTVQSTLHAGDRQRVLHTHASLRAYVILQNLA